MIPFWRSINELKTAIAVGVVDCEIANGEQPGRGNRGAGRGLSGGAGPETANPPEGHPHALKHSCGTHVLARVKDLSVVQKWPGHRSIQSTEVYAKVLGQALQDATAQLRDWR